MAIMKRLQGWLLPGSVAVFVLIGCATPPQPFEYQPSNELKPGPGIFTGEKGVYTIYGRPSDVPEEPDLPGAEPLVEPDDPIIP